jgi:ribosomal protein S18 acetylase RimI-like enzyme
VADPLTFRPADPGELAAFRRASNASYVAERVEAGEDPAAAGAAAVASDKRWFPGGVPAPDHDVVVVESPGGDDGRAAEVVGQLWVGPSPDDPAQWWVYALDVDHAARRRGVGRAAMVHAETLARAHGATAIGLNVFDANPARRLYESLGYEVVSEHPFSVNMTKML